MNNFFVDHFTLDRVTSKRTSQARSHFGNLLLKWYEDPMFFNVDRPLIEFTKVYISNRRITIKVSENARDKFRIKTHVD